VLYAKGWPNPSSSTTILLFGAPPLGAFSGIEINPFVININKQTNKKN
jgi:hypothetical protein